MIRSRHAFLSSLLATCACVVALCTAVVPHSLQAASSYFMIQGPLGAGGAYQTYKFRVEYTGVLSIPGFEPEEQNTSLTLLAAIFGDGTSAEPFINSVGEVSMFSGFVNGFRMEGGTLVVGGINYPVDPQWNYFVSGGSYVNTFPPESEGDYEDDTWTWSFTGVTGRYLEDGSIDAWSYAPHEYSGVDDPVWGPIFFPPLPEDVEPSLDDFTGSQYQETKISANGLPFSVYRIDSVPEPGRALLLLLGVGAVMVRRSRRVCVVDR